MKCGLSLGRGLAMKILFIGVFVSAKTQAQELRGRLVINGIGESSSAPEVARIQVHVTSLCYETSKSAKEANAQLSNKIIDSLGSFSKDPRDHITAVPGPNSLQTELIPDTERDAPLPTNVWSKSTSHRLKSGLRHA